MRRMHSLLFGVAIAAAAGSAADAAPPPGAPLASLLARLPPLSCPRISELKWPGLRYQPKPDAVKNLDPLPLPLGELATDGVTSARAQLMFDIYHDAPEHVTDPSVGTLTIALDPHGVQTAERVLASAAGAVHTAIANDDVWQVQSLYFRKRGAELVLSCSTPAWAQKPWTTDAVTAVSGGIAAMLGNPRAAASKQLGAWTADPSNPGHELVAGQQLRGGRDAASFFVGFETPLPGKALLTAIGAQHVIWTPLDVHRSVWRLTRPDRSPLVYNGWQIDIAIDETGNEAWLANAKASETEIPIDQVRLTSINARPK